MKDAALGEHNFTEPSQVVAFVKCECPGRTVFPNTNMAMKLSEIKPDVVYFTSCLVNANHKCPYIIAEELAKFIVSKNNIKVVQGTHDCH